MKLFFNEPGSTTFGGLNPFFFFLRPAMITRSSPINGLVGSPFFVVFFFVDLDGFFGLILGLIGSPFVGIFGTNFFGLLDFCDFDDDIIGLDRLMEDNDDDEVDVDEDVVVRGGRLGIFGGLNCVLFVYGVYIIFFVEVD